MATHLGNAHTLYNRFRQALNRAQDPGGLLQALADLFPALNVDTAAILATRVDYGRGEPIAIGRPALWSNYLALCLSNADPLSRIVRLSPHPVALSDLRQHPRLLRRSDKLVGLLASNGYNDAFVVPTIDRQLNPVMMVAVGTNLDLRPTKRHLMAQAAADVVARLQCTEDPVPLLPPRIQLTARQMEIAGWLIAGKSDWEIGKILKISPKTVNFHVENIKRAYGVKSRNQFVAAIVHDGGLTPTSYPLAS